MGYELSHFATDPVIKKYESSFNPLVANIKGDIAPYISDLQILFGDQATLIERQDASARIFLRAAERARAIAQDDLKVAALGTDIGGTGSRTGVFLYDLAKKDLNAESGDDFEIKFPMVGPEEHRRADITPEEFKIIYTLMVTLKTIEMAEEGVVILRNGAGIPGMPQRPDALEHADRQKVSIQRIEASKKHNCTAHGNPLDLAGKDRRFMGKTSNNNMGAKPGIWDFISYEYLTNEIPTTSFFGNDSEMQVSATRAALYNDPATRHLVEDKVIFCASPGTGLGGGMINENGQVVGNVHQQHSVMPESMFDTPVENWIFRALHADAGVVEYCEKCKHGEERVLEPEHFLSQTGINYIIQKSWKELTGNEITPEEFDKHYENPRMLHGDDATAFQLTIGRLKAVGRLMGKFYETFKTGTPIFTQKLYQWPEADMAVARRMTASLSGGRAASIRYFSEVITPAADEYLKGHGINDISFIPPTPEISKDGAKYFPAKSVCGNDFTGLNQDGIDNLILTQETVVRERLQRSGIGQQYYNAHGIAPLLIVR